MGKKVKLYFTKRCKDNGQIDDAGKLKEEIIYHPGKSYEVDEASVDRWLRRGAQYPKDKKDLSKAEKEALKKQEDEAKAAEKAEKEAKAKAEKEAAEREEAEKAEREAKEAAEKEKAEKEAAKAGKSKSL